MQVVYIAGPYRAPTVWAIAENIRLARLAAIEVWKLGAAALCPHGNTAHFDGLCPDEIWLKGDIELMRRCDAVLAIDRWELSSGASAEVMLANSMGMPVFFTLLDLETWLAVQPDGLTKEPDGRQPIPG